MSNVSENMSKLEQEAQELVMKLRELNEQIGSYKEAKDSLQETNQEIKSLITATENLTSESGAIIAKFNEISGASFIQCTEDIKERLGGLENVLKANQESMNEANIKLGEISARLDTSRKKSKRRFLFACGGIAIIIALQLIKVFIIDGISISEILTNLRNLI